MSGEPHGELDSTVHRDRRPAIVAVALACAGGVAGCGSSGSSTTTYHFPDAGPTDAGHAHDATRAPADAHRAPVDATPSSDVSSEPRCTPHGGTVALSLHADPLDYGILVDTAAVYYFGLAADAGQVAGDLRSVNKDGTGDTELTITNAQSLTEDDTYLYWGGYDAAFTVGVFRFAKAGGPAELLAPLNELDPQTIVVAGGSVYWTAGVHEDAAIPYELLKAPLDGGAASIVVPGPVSSTPQLCGTDGQNLYWAEPPGHLYAQPLAGGSPQELAPQLMGVQAFDVDDGVLYVNANDGLYALPTAGGAPRLLAESVGAARIAHNATDVYVEQLFQSRIVKVPKKGGTLTTVVSGRTVGSAAFGVDSDCVYWIGPGNDGAVSVPLYKAPN
jgi:hypothetical protein